MRLLIDTNILVYAVNRTDPAHERARQYLTDHLRAQTPWCLTWQVIYEFLRVATHRRVFKNPLSQQEAQAFLDPLLSSPSLSILAPTTRHQDVLRQTLKELTAPAGNLFHDISIAVTLREHGVPEIATADTDFLQFRFLKVINPLLAV